MTTPKEQAQDLAARIIDAGRKDTSICDISSSNINALTPVDYTEVVSEFGSVNVEQALIFVARLVHPVSSLKMSLPSDVESIMDVLTAAFSASRRQELNSGSWTEKVGEAIETVLYTFKMPVVLLTTGGYRVTDRVGEVVFEGDPWGFVHWVRDQETIMIPTSESDVNPLTDPPFVPQHVRDAHDPRKLNYEPRQVSP